MRDQETYWQEQLEQQADYYQQALAFLKETGAYRRAARTLMKLGLTYHTAFDFQRARQAYEEGFALWQRAVEIEPSISTPAASSSRRCSGGCRPADLPCAASRNRCSTSE